MFASGAHVTGIDVSPAIVADAVARNPGLEAVVADVRSLPFAEASFDVVFSGSTLDSFESSADSQVALGELCRVLRPGLTLILTLDNPVNPRGIFRPGSGWNAGPLAGSSALTWRSTPSHRVSVATTYSPADPMDALYEPRHPAADRVSCDWLFEPQAFRWSDMNDPLGRRVWCTLQEEGLGSFWLKSLDALGYRRMYLLRRPLAEPILECPTTLPVEIGWLTLEEVRNYLVFRPDASVHDVTQQLLEGDRCLVARHEDRIVGAVWGSSTRINTQRSLGRDLPLAAGESYQFDAYTLPEVRGMGMAPALSVAWLRHLRDEACVDAILLMFPWNVAALRSYAKAGYRVTAVVRCVRLGPWRYVFPLQLVSP